MSAFAAYPRIAAAQERWSGKIEGSCSFYPNDVMESDLYTFGSSDEAVEVVRRITNAVGLAPNFEVRQANVPNAAATINNGRRIILYSQVFIEKIVSKTTTEWSSLTIMAHEVGHHLNGHTLGHGGSRPPIELQADHFAGHAVKQLGGSLDDAQACFLQMGAAGSETHPPRSARLEAVTRGWREATGPLTQRRPPEQQTPSEDVQPTRTVKSNVSLGYLNMRSGPGTNYSAVVRIPAGSDGVSLIGKCVKPVDGVSRSSFCQVQWKGHAGWVSSSGLE